VAALQPSERVLDIACGTGIVARTAARKLDAGGSAASREDPALSVAG
jgi:cyclopropane fatty-acyl-phospholipid synthase-like methyltransferase